MSLVDRIHAFSSAGVPRGTAGVNTYPLEEKVRALLGTPAPAGWRPTGIGQARYLDIMEPIVRAAAGWLDAEGRIIDPVARRETGQASPRFAAPGAILLLFRRAPEIRDAVVRCMDYCCATLPGGGARKNSPDFWMRELVTAYMALESIVHRDELAHWAAGLSAVEPETVYTHVSPDGSRLAALGNWAIYAAGGEVMREAAGLRPPRECLWGNAFFERYVGAQLGEFTDCGMYRDPGDPITYDITTRLQVACGLAFGYRGAHRAVLDELLRRGGLTTLLFASPGGFCPYGGRSDAFHFREAILAALCELEARRYRKDNPRLAGAFKRQAHLAALSVQRWMAEMQPWRHIRNGFDPAMRHGCDPYGHYSVYSLLAASFFGLAAVFADDTIAEAPCPAETGGFAFELAPAFHKVFANCAGSFVEIDTAADPHHNATGAGRFTARGVPPELGLDTPFPAVPVFAVAPGCLPPARPVAIGPAWRQGGQWVSLAELSEGLTHQVAIHTETPDTVGFTVTYRHDAITVVEDYRLEAGRLTIAVRRPGPAPSSAGLRFIVPLLVSDGCSRSSIRGPAMGEVTVTYLGHRYTVRHAAPAGAAIEPAEYANRNGIYRSLVIEAAGNEMKILLTLE